MKKFLTVVLMLCMVATSVVFAGGAKEPATSSVAGSSDVPGWKAAAANPIEFDWYLHFSWFARHWGDSVVSKYITDKTNLKNNYNRNKVRKLFVPKLLEIKPSFIKNVSKTRIETLLKRGKANVFSVTM